MFYFEDKNCQSISGNFRGIPACHKILNTVISSIVAEPSYSESPYRNVTTANVYLELRNLMMKYNDDKLDEFISYITEQSICINPTAAIQVTLPEMYQFTVSLSLKNLKDYPSYKKIIEAQKTLTMLQTAIYNFRNQLYTKYSKGIYDGIDVGATVGSDDEACTTAELMKSIDYTEDFVRLEDARQIFKFLFKSFWLMCLIYKGQRYIPAEQMGNEMYTILAQKWTADTYEWEGIFNSNSSSQNILTNMDLVHNVHTRYFNVYEDSEHYGPRLVKADITNISVNAANRTLAAKAISSGLAKSYTLYKNDPTLQNNKFKDLESNTSLWARYMFVLLSNVNQPFFNESNPRNYTVQDILYFITDTETNSNSLASQIPIRFLSPDYVDNYSTYEEWAESLNDIGMAGTRDYLLNYCPNNFISIPNIQIQSLESIIQEQTSNDIIVADNNSPTITKLYPRIYVLNNLAKLISSNNSSSLFKTLFKDLYDQMFIRQDVQIKSAAKHIELPTERVNNNFKKFHRAFTSDINNSRETYLLQKYEEELHKMRDNILTMGGGTSALMEGELDWTPTLKDCISRVTESAVQNYKNSILDAYRVLKINSPYVVRPVALERILRNNVAYNGPAECLSILGEPIIVDINIVYDSTTVLGTMAFLPNHMLLIVSRDSDSVNLVSDRKVIYDASKNQYSYHDSTPIEVVQ